jgi:hypothetical protein
MSTATALSLASLEVSYPLIVTKKELNIRSFLSKERSFHQISNVAARLSGIARTQPHLFEKETGRLVYLLGASPEGISREELLEQFYPNYKTASPTLRHSFVTRLGKVVQRARVKFNDLGIELQFCRTSKTWKLLCIEEF